MFDMDCGMHFMGMSDYYYEVFLFQADMGNLWRIAGVLMLLLAAGVLIPALRTLHYQPADVLERE